MTRRASLQCGYSNTQMTSDGFNAMAFPPHQEHLFTSRQKRFGSQPMWSNIAAWDSTATPVGHSGGTTEVYRHAHRKSQPSLFAYGRAGDPCFPPPGQIRHIPSQPMLAQFGTTFPASLAPTSRRVQPVIPPAAVGSAVSAPQSPRFTVGPFAHHGSATFATVSAGQPIGNIGSHSPIRKLPRASEKRILKRCPQSDLSYRFQRNHYQIDERSNSNESTPSRTEEVEIDPIYLALKQATGKYSSPRGSHNFDSATPSPRNLSQVSLQDSGYAETSGSRHQLLGSTPQLDQNPNGFTTGRPRAPKLHKQMKSLSLDCAEMPPPVNSALRSPFKSKPLRQARGYANSGEMPEWNRSVSPTGSSSPRRLPPQPVLGGTHIVTHEYIQSPENALYLGDRLNIVDNGDPDWLHGYKANDRLEQLLTFPSTCVAMIRTGEQPMKLTQNVLTLTTKETKLRLYRDQVVFAQPDSITENKVLVRNEHGTLAYCPLTHLMLI